MRAKVANMAKPVKNPYDGKKSSGEAFEILKSLKNDTTLNNGVSTPPPSKRLRLDHMHGGARLFEQGGHTPNLTPGVMEFKATDGAPTPHPESQYGSVVSPPPTTTPVGNVIVLIKKNVSKLQRDYIQALKREASTHQKLKAAKMTQAYAAKHLSQRKEELDSMNILLAELERKHSQDDALHSLCMMRAGASNGPYAPGFHPLEEEEAKDGAPAVASMSSSNEFPSDDEEDMLAVKLPSSKNAVVVEEVQGRGSSHVHTVLTGVSPPKANLTGEFEGEAV